MRKRLPWVMLLALTPTVFTDNSSTTWCEKLQKQYSPGKRYLSVNGTEKNISLYWGSDPAYAASTLFYVILHYAHGYQNVRLQHGEHSLTQLAKNVPYDAAGEYEEAILALATAWDPTSEDNNNVEHGYSTGLGGPRLQEIGASTIPTRLRLHVHLPTVYRTEQCKNLAQWNFYLNDTTLIDCGFTDSLIRDADINHVVVYLLDSNNRTKEVAEALKIRANAVQIFVKFEKFDRQSLFQKLHAGNQSFLFIDYDMWAGKKRNINIVQEPPCLSNDFACQSGLDNSIGMRLADVFLLAEYASQLFELARLFKPPMESLIFILEENANKKSIEEAACEWAFNNYDVVRKNWVKKYRSKKKKYEIAVFYCRKDPEITQYKDLFRLLRNAIYQQYKSNFIIILREYSTNYFDVKYIKNEINYYMTHGIRQRLIGAVVGGNNKIIEAAEAFDESGIPVLMYDVATTDMDSTSSVWLTTGRLSHLAIAIKHFIGNNSWGRVAVLSDSTRIANQFLENFSNTSDFLIRDYAVQRYLSEEEATEVLQRLKYENAHIIVVNTLYRDAVTILKAAANLNMNDIAEYTWIVRDWEAYDKNLNVKFFTFSFWPILGQHVYSTSHKRLLNLTYEMDKLWPGYKWSRSAAALIDAVLTLAEGFQDVVLKYPQAREDTHSTQAIRQFGKSLIDLSPIKGFTQNLTFKEHSLEETAIFLEEWYDGKCKMLAQWRVNAASSDVIIENFYQEAYPSDGAKQNVKPSDGTSNCLVSTGDPYLPTCYDGFWIAALVLFGVAPPIMVLIYRSIRQHFMKLQMKVLSDLLAQRMERAATLSSYLVNRSALRPRQELGAGRFGCVRLADLLVPGCKPRVVAAKELRDDQDESEILREACILASLHHDNIIRLVGVCIDNEPTLVLMEVAFFGDLLQYLKDRRHIAEAFDSNMEMDQVSEEAVHVSAKSLTRLAREAASALAYLALCGVIHRDLRASNCLVDERRCLKLADFGLARETKVKGMDGGGEYACRRRGLFPVLWMAPESLMYGVFSTASDVYSLGMLIFELITLGARPYGMVSPLRVMQYVTSGGNPQMPADATPQTTALAQLCWQRQPEKRPTAADVVAYLAEHPNALSPALDYENIEYCDGDSGYGEPQSTKMLP